MDGTLTWESDARNSEFTSTITSKTTQEIRSQSRDQTTISHIFTKYNSETWKSKWNNYKWKGCHHNMNPKQLEHLRELKVLK